MKWYYGRTLALVALSKVWPLSRMGASWSWAAPNILFSSLLLLWQFVPMERWVFRWRCCWDLSCCCCWYRRRGLGPGPFWRNHHQKKSRITPLLRLDDDSDGSLKLRTRLNYNCNENIKQKQKNKSVENNFNKDHTFTRLSFYAIDCPNPWRTGPHTTSSEPFYWLKTPNFRLHFRIAFTIQAMRRAHSYTNPPTFHEISPWSFMLIQ